MNKDTGTQDANLKEYQAKLDRLIAEDSTAIFANYSRAHARCIIKTFLSGAKERADILAGDFGNDFYQNPAIQDALRKALCNRATIRVISLGTSPESKAAVMSFSEELKSQSGPERFQVKFARVRPGARVKHYMIIDNKRYRLEDYHDEGSDTVHAEVCCNGQKKAALLTCIFESLWNMLSPSST